MSLPHRYLFCGGLHRSGTSLVAQGIASHPGVAGIGGSPAPEDEGVYLQGAIPHTARSGIPGSFAEDDAQHLTEASAFNTRETRDRLVTDWAPWFDAGAAWRIEKSPVNLTRARLLQQLFPLSLFVFVVRHPIPVTMATAKWSDRDPAALLGHWNAAHGRLLEDWAYLHNAMILRYEDVVADPQASFARVFRFMEVPPHAPDIAVSRAVNDAYFEDWTPVRADAAIAAQFGYTLDPPATGPMPLPPVKHVYRSVVDAVKTGGDFGAP